MTFINTLNAAQFEQVYLFLSQRSYWSKGIEKNHLKKALNHSLCFAIVEQNNLKAFARVVTDRATFANLLDVFVLEQYRGQGLSKALIKHIISHEDLQSLRRFTLVTKDAHSLYQQFGFKTTKQPELSMEKLRICGYRDKSINYS